MAKPRPSRKFIVNYEPSSSPSSDAFELLSSHRSRSRSPVRSPTRQNKQRSPTKRTRDLIYAPGKTYNQRFSLPVNHNQIGFRIQPPSGLEIAPSVPRPQNSSNGDTILFGNDGASFLGTAHQKKRLTQFFRWQNEVLPRLVPVYLQYIRCSQNLALDLEVNDDYECTGCCQTTALEVTVVRFNKLELLEIELCPCQPAATQLMKRGLFGCAPLRPSLAVDIRVLDFVVRLNTRVSPNNTAWCDTVKEFLELRGFHLRGKDPLRRRFGNALQWYGVLQDLAKHHIELKLDTARKILRHEDWEGGQGESEGENEENDSLENEVPSRKRQRGEEVDGQPLIRPSETLRRRCPACFGGKDEYQEGVSVIVCLDACFTQKNNKHAYRDPKLEHPNSVFISEEDEEAMRLFVESVRPYKPPRARGKGKRRTTVQDEDDDEDEVDPRLKVPSSVLNGCERSFTAADETREKASTTFFESTALMGILCRHDRVLWLVNMKTAGERQHYVLTLIERLFQHLPPSYTVGLLYDIACSLERSCIKWGFLAEYLPRMEFAVSVFHAYGHGWPCQCIYHPRKRQGFGLSDGEGCERFWFSISRLIAYLRVCGHHRRIYTLDSQIEHDEHEGILELAQFLVRRYNHAKTKRAGAEIAVQSSMRSAEFLREQWKAQVEDQMKSLPRQTRNAAKKAVEEALRRRTIRDTISSRVSRLETQMLNVAAERYEIVSAQGELADAREQLRKAENSLREWERKLGTSDLNEYKKVANSAFLTARMNALAVKERLRYRLSSHKFERDRVERAGRRQSTSERKLQQHIHQTVTRREPGLEALLRTLNNLISTMERLKREGRAPANAAIPRRIPSEELFSLDVDDSIWDDIGLHDGDDLEQPPLWSCDELVRSGIRGVLLRDRCDEELERLNYERRAIQDWFMEEYTVVAMAIEGLTTEDRDIRYHLEMRRLDLCRQCVIWRAALAALSNKSHEAWGPSEAELEVVTANLNVDVVSQGIEKGEDEEEDDFFEIFENDDLDEGLIACVDAMDLNDGRDFEDSGPAVFEYE